MDQTNPIAKLTFDAEPFAKEEKELGMIAVIDVEFLHKVIGGLENAADFEELMLSTAQEANVRIRVNLTDKSSERISEDPVTNMVASPRIVSSGMEYFPELDADMAEFLPLLSNKLAKLLDPARVDIQKTFESLPNIKDIAEFDAKMVTLLEYASGPANVQMLLADRARAFADQNPPPAPFPDFPVMGSINSDMAQLLSYLQKGAVLTTYLEANKPKKSGVRTALSIQQNAKIDIKGINELVAMLNLPANPPSLPSTGYSYLQSSYKFVCPPDVVPTDEEGYDLDPHFQLRKVAESYLNVRAGNGTSVDDQINKLKDLNVKDPANYPSNYLEQVIHDQLEADKVRNLIINGAMGDYDDLGTQTTTEELVSTLDSGQRAVLIQKIKDIIAKKKLPGFLNRQLPEIAIQFYTRMLEKIESLV